MRVVRVRHLKPRLLVRRANVTIVVDPHGKPLRSAVVSLAKIFVWLMEEWCANLFHDKNSALLICDRYYHDLLVDPVRYRYGGPIWAAKVVGKLMPQPDLWILLDAPPQVLQTRKQEVAFEETARQRSAYLTFVRNEKNFAIVDAAQSLDKVVADVKQVTLAAVSKLGRFYQVQDRSTATHLALSWSGQVRFTVPRERAAQQACWKNFRLGRIAFPMRAIARLPRIFGAANCVETADLAAIRQMLGKEAGVSCCRRGAEGAWQKDTILFLDKRGAPLYIVKAGGGGAVNALLENEAQWLQRLRGEPTLIDRVPEFVAHHADPDLCFVAQSVLGGTCENRLGEPHFDFLRKLHVLSFRPMRYEDSLLYRTLSSRLKELRGKLTEPWSIRLSRATRQIEESLSHVQVPLVAAHNDFAPWNIRIDSGVARVFDWEYAADEQLPLFDPLHFALMPLALYRKPSVKIVEAMNRTVQLCHLQFGKERCHEHQAQCLAYFVSVCSLYLYAEAGRSCSNPVLESYASMIDLLLQ